MRVRFHDDARLRAVLPCLPRARRVDGPVLLVVLRRLPEIPDVAVLVLGVLVEGVLDQLPVEAYPVPEDDAGYAEDLLGVAGHVILDALEAVFHLPLEDERLAGLQRKVRVVYLFDKISGVYLRRISTRRLFRYLRRVRFYETRRRLRRPCRTRRSRERTSCPPW